MPLAWQPVLSRQGQLLHCDHLLLLGLHLQGQAHSAVQWQQHSRIWLPASTIRPHPGLIQECFHLGLNSLVTAMSGLQNLSPTDTEMIHIEGKEHHW